MSPQLSTNHSTEPPIYIVCCYSGKGTDIMQENCLVRPFQGKMSAKRASMIKRLSSN